MLESITNISFADFGYVEYNGFDAAVNKLGYHLIKQRQLSDKKSNTVFINKTQSTVLDILSGTAIVYIGKNPNNLKAFLLDKTIVVNPDIYFVVIPLIKNATFAIASGKDIKAVNNKFNTQATDITPNLNINNIHTLFYHEKERGFSFKGERHSFWELTYVDKGYMYNVLNDKVFKLSQGDLMITTPNTYHSQHTDENVSVCYITISFEMDYANNSIFINEIFKTDSDIKALLKKLLFEKENPIIYSQDLILAYLKEIIILLIRSKELERMINRSDKSVVSSVENDIVEQAKNYIRKNIYKNPSVSMTAKSIPVSPGYLSTIFKKHTGLTVVKYIRNEKLECAKDYLRQGKYSVTQVSQLLSFSSVHYFSKQFKSEFGITPSEYALALKK